MLVACQLVNLTNWDKARHVFDELVRRWLDAAAMAAVGPDDVYPVVAGLGLGTRRSVNLVRMARSWVETPLDRVIVTSLPGCGRYAADSWAIFIEGRTDVKVTDGELHWFLNELREGRKTL